MTAAQPESAQISFSWTINSEGGDSTNNSPAINFIGAQTHTVEDAVSLQVFGSDPDVGDILTYSATGLPDGLSIDNASGLIAGTIATGADTRCRGRLLMRYSSPSPMTAHLPRAPRPPLPGT